MRNEFTDTYATEQSEVVYNINTQNISGENDVKEIPVPMPNTEVKLYVPKILGGFLPGKIGLRQFFYFVYKANYKNTY